MEQEGSWAQEPVRTLWKRENLYSDPLFRIEIRTHVKITCAISTTKNNRGFKEIQTAESYTSNSNEETSTI
jgi:hypothetical protein